MVFARRNAHNNEQLDRHRRTFASGRLVAPLPNRFHDDITDFGIATTDALGLGDTPRFIDHCSNDVGAEDPVFSPQLLPLRLNVLKQ